MDLVYARSASHIIDSASRKWAIFELGNMSFSAVAAVYEGVNELESSVS